MDVVFEPKGGQGSIIEIPGAILKIYDQVNDRWVKFPSNSVNVEPDTAPPAAVIDLTATSPTSNSINLTWTAPGDDRDVGTASKYDIRYSTEPITEDNWDGATQCEEEPTPQPAGSKETFTVTGLSPGTTYYFALKTADEVPNWSELSNCVSATTLTFRLYLPIIMKKR